MENKLKELRARFKMTQGELAGKTGVSRQAIIAIENERYAPSLPLAFRLAKAFRCKIEEVFSDV